MQWITDKNRIRKYNLMSVFFLLFLLFVAIYHKIPFVFFQQDEWFAFGNIISLGYKLIFHRFKVGDVNHFVPLNSFLSFLLFKIFNLNYQGYNIVALLLHFINGLLVYFLALKILKKRLFALLAAVLFIASAAAAELVMWPLVGINTLALTFALLAWLAVLKYQKEKGVFVTGLLVAILTILALLTNEYAGGLLLFIPIFIFILTKRAQVRYAFRFLLPFLVSGFGYILFRLSILGGGGVLAGESILKTILPKALQFPVRYLGQLLLPKQALILPGQLLGDKLVLSDFALLNVFLLFGLLVLGLILAVSITVRRNSLSYAKDLILVLVFILASSVPFAFIPGEAGNFLIFSPRYLYFGTAGSAILIAQLTELAYSSKRSILKNFASLYVLLFFFLGVFGNWSRANDLFLEGKLRGGFLNEIKERYPFLARKAVFYTESDSTFYGLPPEERIMPFQSGFGQTLLVWYQETEQFPTEFFQDRFLWEITDEGYKEIEDRGFGYFRDFELMGETIKEKDIPGESVIAFRYDSETSLLNDMTQEVQGRITGYLSKKRVIPTSNLVIYASENNKNISFAMDGRRNTFWESELPYKGQQHIKVDLKRKRKIAQVRIDSYNDKNQDKVGYRLFLSDNGKDWQEVFYAKRYPPNKEGLVDLYFRPQASQYIEIKQIGFHRFAPWAVHELEVYEAIE